MVLIYFLHENLMIWKGNILNGPKAELKKLSNKNGKSFKLLMGKLLYLLVKTEIILPPSWMKDQAESKTQFQRSLIIAKWLQLKKRIRMNLNNQLRLKKVNHNILWKKLKKSIKILLKMNIWNSLNSIKISFIHNILNGLILKFKTLSFFFGERNNVLRKKRKNKLFQKEDNQCQQEHSLDLKKENLVSIMMKLTRCGDVSQKKVKNIGDN